MGVLYAVATSLKNSYRISLAVSSIPFFAFLLRAGMSIFLSSSWEFVFFASSFTNASSWSASSRI